MAEFTETTRHIKINSHGTPVLAETNTNIVPIGVAHEQGVREEWLLDQYQISRAQLHAALAYFYEHRDAIQVYLEETQRLMKQHGASSRKKLDELRKRP